MTEPTDLCKASRAAEQAAYAAGTHLQASRSRLAETVITGEAPGAVADAIECEARRLICDVVQKHFPTHRIVDAAPGEPPVLAAGGTGESAGDGAAAPTWVVDPVDGRANYLRGYPQYAVTLAFVEAGVPVLGVVYDPCRNEFFGAIRGRGAVLNGAPIRCADRRAAPEALAATVFPKAASPRMPAYMAELGRVLRGLGGVRRSGSMALELASLAAGRIDAFWEHDTRPWKAAAAAVLLRESGALLSARDGAPLLASASLLACTPPLYEAFLSLLAEA